MVERANSQGSVTPRGELVGSEGVTIAQTRDDSTKALAHSILTYDSSIVRRPRIGFLLFSLGGGGAEKVMIQLAGELVRRGLTIDFVLIRKEGPYLNQVPPGVHIVDLAAGRTLFSIGPLYRYLRHTRPTALLSALTAVNVAAIVAAKLSFRKMRVVVTEHSQVTTEFDHAKGLMTRLAFRLLPLVYPFANDIVAVSKGVAEDVAKFAHIKSDRIKVVYNGVISPSFRNLASKPVDHPWLASDQPPVILSAGRMVAQKDFPTLIKAFAQLRKDRKARLIILGEGNDRTMLEQLADHLGVRSDIDLPGFMENPYALMARAKVFVLSSAWEGLPTVLIEALACGTPVVATDCPSGPAEILQGGHYGKLVPVGDVSALAVAITETMDHPLDPDALRSRAADFTVAQSADHYLSVLLGNGQHA